MHSMIEHVNYSWHVLNDTGRNKNAAREGTCNAHIPAELQPIK
jgi:hypothetical protein